MSYPRPTLFPSTHVAVYSTGDDAVTVDPRPLPGRPGGAGDLPRSAPGVIREIVSNRHLDA
jgi:hypothetical protein